MRRTYPWPPSRLTAPSACSASGSSASSSFLSPLAGKQPGPPKNLDTIARLDYNFPTGPRGKACRESAKFLASKTGHEGRETLVSEVKINDNESFETALKRFNRKIQQDGILPEARRREHYEKPSVKRKRKETTSRPKSPPITAHIKYFLPLAVS